MTNTKKILTGLVLSGILSSGLYANCGMNKKHNMDYNKSCKMSHKMMKKSHHSNPIIKMVRHLDLTKEQRVSIKQIMKEDRKNKRNKNMMGQAFSETSFDKSRFIDIMNKKKNRKIQSRADMIEKVYGILNPVQKKYLKVLLEKKQNQKYNNKEKRFNNKG